MTLSEIKENLKQLEELQFLLPNGDSVPPHFHVTEIGKITKQFIDCGVQALLSETPVEESLIFGFSEGIPQLSFARQSVWILVK
jgi:hypothetical protein